MAGKEPTMDDRAGLMLVAYTAAANAALAVELAFSLSGTTGIYVDSPIERCFRDMQVVRQQRLLADGRYETFGQMYFGLEPDFITVII